MEEKYEHVLSVLRLVRARMVRACPVEVKDFLLMNHSQKEKQMADPLKLRVKLKNGPELRRLLDVLSDATTVVSDEETQIEIDSARDRLKESLADLTWLKNLISLD